MERLIPPIDWLIIRTRVTYGQIPSHGIRFVDIVNRGLFVGHIQTMSPDLKHDPLEDKFYYFDQIQILEGVKKLLVKRQLCLHNNKKLN